MKLDAHALIVLALGPAVGWVMLQSGVFKQMLERKKDNKVCPSCGRATPTCICAGA